MKTPYDVVKNCWYYYLSIEKDLNETSRYIEPNGQENVYSFEFQKIIMLCGAEIETIFKLICSAIDEKRVCGNIGEYKSVILGSYPKIGEAQVVVPRWNSKKIYPFEGWARGPLKWWSAYTEVKHNRATAFSIATYKNAVCSLAALYVLILYLYKINGYSCKGDESTYIFSDYYPQPCYIDMQVELPDFYDTKNEEVIS